MQYGPRIAACVIYLQTYQLLPEDRLVELMAVVLGVKLRAGTVGNMSRARAARLRDFATKLRDLVAAAPVKHMDETGFRIGGKLQWLHIASTALMTFYRACAQRGDMLANVVGVVVHDHWKPYYTMQGVLHALCNTHHLRELKALIEIEKEPWARRMQRRPIEPALSATVALLRTRTDLETGVARAGFDQPRLVPPRRRCSPTAL